MLRLFLTLWCSLPHRVRQLMRIAPIVVGAIVSLVIWDWPPIVVGAGISLFYFVLPDASEAEKKGYHF